VDGFEPPTSCSQSRRATRLHHTQNERGGLVSPLSQHLTGLRSDLSGACPDHVVEAILQLALGNDRGLDLSSVSSRLRRHEALVTTMEIVEEDTHVYGRHDRLLVGSRLRGRWAGLGLNRSLRRRRRLRLRVVRPSGLIRDRGRRRSRRRRAGINRCVRHMRILPAKWRSKK
jgi:hypothetical protein